ncbi:unnamed protein product [Ixodes pacificus]
MCSQTEQKTHGYRRVSVLEGTSSSFVDNDSRERIRWGSITIGSLPSTKATERYESVYIIGQEILFKLVTGAEANVFSHTLLHKYKCYVKIMPTKVEVLTKWRNLWGYWKVHY